MTRRPLITREDEFTPPAQPLMLRPSRKPLIWLLPLCAVLAWLCAKAYGSAGVPSVFVFLLAVLVVQAALIFKLLRGYTGPTNSVSVAAWSSGPGRCGGATPSGSQ